MKARKLYWFDVTTKKASIEEISYLVSEDGEVAIEFPGSTDYPRDHRIQILRFGKVVYDAVLTKHLEMSNQEIEELNQNAYRIVGYKKSDRSLAPYWARTLSPELQAIAKAMED